MQKYYSSPTATTPEILFSPEENLFFICGTSSPEDVRAMYYPVIEWINSFINEIIGENQYSYSKENPFRLKVDLAYFNSSSAKFFYDIFLELKRLFNTGVPVVIEWVYEEEDIDLKEAGTDISLLAGIEFTYIQKNK